MLISGARIYLKYVPFFFIPLVFSFSTREIKNLLYLLLAFSLFQLPIAIYQRFVESGGAISGDLVRGTLPTSSLLSVYLLCVFSIVFAFYLKKQLSLKLFVSLSFLLLIPTAINDTKGTVILLPIAVFLPALFSDMNKRKFTRLFGASLACLGILAMFSFGYNQLYGEKHTVAEFFTDEYALQKKLAPKVSGIEPYREGRIDVIIAPFIEFSDQPFKLLYGLGAGNVGESFLGDRYTGAYHSEYGNRMYLAMANLILETGLLGVLLVMIFWAKISKDAFRLRTHSGLEGAIALGWLGVMGILFLSLFYKNIINVNVIGYLFWFFAGYIASESLKADSRNTARASELSKYIVKPHNWTGISHQQG